MGTNIKADIAVPNGDSGFGTLLRLLCDPPFVQDKTGTLPANSYFFFVESTGNFVEVDGIIAGFMAFPTIEKADIIEAGSVMKLKFLGPRGLLLLKLSSWANKARRSGPKPLGDISDTTSIRELLTLHGVHMNLRDLPGDAAKGLSEWVKEFGDLDTWRRLDRQYSV